MCGSVWRRRFLFFGTDEFNSAILQNLIVFRSCCISFHWRSKCDHDVCYFLSSELVIAVFEILQDGLNCCSTFEVAIAGLENGDDRISSGFEVLREDGLNQAGLEMESFYFALV